MKTFQDGLLTVVIVPLPLGTDSGTAVPTRLADVDGSSNQGERLTNGNAFGLFSYPTGSSIKGVRWNVGADYFSSTGERGQVASFPDATVLSYPKLKVYEITTDTVTY